VLPSPHFQELLSKLGMVNTLDHSSLWGRDKHALTASDSLSQLAALLAEHITTSIVS